MLYVDDNDRINPNVIRTSSGCGSDGAIDAIEKLWRGNVVDRDNEFIYPSRMTENWDIGAFFSDNTPGFSSGCGSTPGTLLGVGPSHYFNHQHDLFQSFCFASTH